MINFSGTWDIVSSPDFDDDYLSEEVSPYVKLQQSGSLIFKLMYHQGDDFPLLPPLGYNTGTHIRQV